jgi:glyoxylase-like metal-dependent hydrolase (beta-lactamase superfamily II)
MADIERLVVGPLATNCYILKSGEELMVIDPGGDADRIIARLRELEETVRYVVDTHAHIDHVSANRPVLEATGAELLIHRDDVAMLAQPDTSLASMVGFTVEPMTPARELVDGDEVTVGDATLRVLHTPGHTPGGICLLGDGYAFTGDTLFVDSIGRTDFPGGSIVRIRESLALLRTRLAAETMLYPGHGEPGTFARALLVNPFLGDGWPA